MRTPHMWSSKARINHHNLGVLLICAGKMEIIFLTHLLNAARRCYMRIPHMCKSPTARINQSIYGCFICSVKGHTALRCLMYTRRICKSSTARINHNNLCMLSSVRENWSINVPTEREVLPLRPHFASFLNRKQEIPRCNPDQSDYT